MPFPSLTMLLGAAVFAAFAIYVWTRRSSPGAAALLLTLGAGIWYMATYAAELASAAPAAKLAWGDVKYVGVTLMPPAWLAFTLQYAGRPARIGRRLVALLGIEPVSVLVLLAIPATHDLVRFRPAAEAGQRFPVIGLGWVGWLNVVYSYTLIVAGTAMFALTLARTARPYRRPAAVLLGVLVVPFALNVLYNFDVGPFGRIDLTPFAFVLAVSVIVWGLLRLRLVDIVPVARSRIVETLRDGVVVLDAYGRVVDLNPSAQRILGATPGRAVGLPIAQVMPHHLPDRWTPSDATPDRMEVRLGPEPGAGLYELTISPIADDRGRESGRLLVLRDISEQKLTEERLEHLAHYDGLTGLPNRKLFGDRLSQAIIRARRSHERVGLLFLDVDYFKDVNDTLGHDVGDLLLEQLARRLQACLRAEDTVARLSGDEFTVIVPELAAPRDTVPVATRIFEALHQPFLVADHELYTSVSIGICVWPEDGGDPRMLVRNADAAMYRAKANGRNRFEFYASDLSVRATRRLELEQDLRRAVERGELRTHFQPIFGQPHRPPVALEALVRWQHPKLGMVGPSHFLWRAEETGLIETIGAWVLEQAAREAASWGAGGTLPPAVAVNVSARQLRRSGFASEVADVLDRAGLPADRLVLEISENVVMEDPLILAGTLHELRALGLRLSLDDFGIGSTSLSQLGRLPFDILKIDRLFVQDLERGHEGAIVVQAMISLAHALNLLVVAEGVESPAQHGALQRLGCDLFQGFLFSRPLPPPLPADLLLGKGPAPAAVMA